MAQTSEKAPFFSIITVTLNNLKGLQKTYEFIQNQTLKDFEWIVIDGASSDGTSKWLKTTNAHWISEQDSGIYDAMNKGLKDANGEYCLFLNAGDLLAQNTALQALKSAIDGQDFIYGDSFENEQYKPARVPNITNGMFTHHQAMLYRRKALKGLEYDTSFKIAGDYDLTARLLQKTQSILYVPTPICIFESGGISQTDAQTGRKEQYDVRKKLKLCSPLKNAAIYFAQTLLWNFRMLCPALYWHLKSSGNNAAGSSQTGTQHHHPNTPA